MIFVLFISCLWSVAYKTKSTYQGKLLGPPIFRLVKVKAMDKMLYNLLKRNKLSCMVEISSD